MELKKLLSTLLFLVLCYTHGQVLTGGLEFEDANVDYQESKTNLLESMAEDKLPVRVLIKMGDENYDKMWYAEAAKYYDEALERMKEEPTKEVLQRAGDSHYFVGNMDKANKLYEMLYEKYKEELNDQDIFKYVHSLQGSGKENTAKRILNAFQKDNKEFDESAYEKLREEKEGLFIQNLEVNTENSDFSPVFYPGGKVVFSSAKIIKSAGSKTYKWNNQPYLNLFQAERDLETDQLNNPTPLSTDVNDKYHEASATFTADGKTMYFTRNNYSQKIKRGKKNINHLKLYSAEKVGEVWDNVTELPFNGESFSTGHPALSHDGKKLYFVSDRPGGIGQTDIYVVDILGKNQFSAPKNLGGMINSDGREMFPFVDNEAIYFASDRLPGLGGLDIYKSTFKGDQLDTPKNMGAPFNSNLDDFSFVIDTTATSLRGYFASNREGGNGNDDIYSFRMEEKELPKDAVIVGNVKDLISGELLPYATVSLLDANNTLLTEAITEEDGAFKFENLSRETDYTIATNKETYNQDAQTVNTENNPETLVDVMLMKGEEITAAQKIPAVLEEKTDEYVDNVSNDIIENDSNGNLKMRIDPILFDFDRYDITAKAEEEMQKLLSAWETYPNMVIRIESHTDSRGSGTYNNWLSQKRADATRDYLIANGIDASLIESATGYGEEMLLNECYDGVSCSAAQHRKNRRSEFFIISGVDDGGVAANTKYKKVLVQNNDYDTDRYDIASVEETTVAYDINELVAHDNEGNLELTIDPIHFDYDSYDLRTDAINQLEKLITVWETYPNLVIRVESFTDSRGSKEYNLNLSQLRAEVTKEYLISRGIEASLIQSAEGYGEESLINDCYDGNDCSENFHQLNRRSEFVIIQQ